MCGLRAVPMHSIRPPCRRVTPLPVGEVYCELPPGSNWNFDVQWAPGQVRFGPSTCRSSAR